MSFLQSILLGIVQGITEFLPVSSSAHLKLVKHLLGMQESGSHVLFDLSCHLGSLTALIFFFRKDLMDMLFKKREPLYLICLAIIPLIPCYFLLKPLRDMASQAVFLGPCLIITGLILLAGQSLRVSRSNFKRPSSKIRDVLMIGALQAAALIPGISRSAATISCARTLGWSASEAVRFSFLLAIPTVMGGNFLECIKLIKANSTSTLSISSILIAFTTSSLVSFFVIKKSITFLEKGNFKPFILYCLGLGILVTLYFRG